MRKQLGIAIVITLALLCAGCGDPHERLANKMIDNMEEMYELLKDVKGAESAKKAAADFEKLAKRQEELAAEMSKLPEPSPEVKKRVENIMDTRGKTAFTNLIQEMMRVGELDPEAAKVFQRGVPRG